jgi:ABC-2 type transport system permease protein
MFRNVFLKTLYTLRWQLLGWTIAIVSIAFLTMVLYPSFSQTGIEDIVNSVPDSLKSLVGNVADFKTIPGYIGQQIFGPNLYIVSLILAVLIYMAVSANEEADGRMQSLLSFPISRSSVYFQKWLAATTVVLAVSLSVIIALWPALMIIHESADYSRILESILAIGLINICYGMVAFAISMATGSKPFAILVGAGYAVASLFITSLAPAVEKLQTVDMFSLLHYYNNPQIMTHGLNSTDMLILLGVFVLLTLLGWIGFLRRDVRTN